MSEGFIGDLFDSDTEDSTGYHCYEHREVGVKAEAGHHSEYDIAADHNNVSVGEVKHFSDAIDEGIAEGYDGIDASEADTVYKVIQKSH